MTPATELRLEERELLALALDPIHVGTGEFRLGRVDNTIVRDPGTNLPKIPGSSIAGVTRAYMAMIEGQYLRTKKVGDKEELESCAGKGGADGMQHCGKATCRVCVGFGFSRSGSSFQGLFTFTDACILLFPVASMKGPFWVTSNSVLEDAGFDQVMPLPESGEVVTSLDGAAGKLNLGWICLTRKPAVSLPIKLGQIVRLKIPVDRIAVVNDEIFDTIVNDNLEVRTSVSIDPTTGAAAKGALFTAEAIPRGTVFHFKQSTQNADFFRVPGEQGGKISFEKGALHDGVYKAMQQMEWLGVGGLNTRGMGRLKVCDPSAPVTPPEEGTK